MPMIAVLEIGIFARLFIQRRVRLIKKEMGFRLFIPLIVEDAIIPPILPRLIQKENGIRIKTRLNAR